MYWLQPALPLNSPLSPKRAVISVPSMTPTTASRPLLYMVTSQSLPARLCTSAVKVATIWLPASKASWFWLAEKLVVAASAAAKADACSITPAGSGHIIIVPAAGAKVRLAPSSVKVVL